MPNKKRSHGRDKQSKQSQPKQSTPAPTASGSTVKPAQHEKGGATVSAAAGAKPATTKASTGTTSAPKTTVSTAATGSVTTIGPSTGPKVSGGASTAVVTKSGSSKPTPQSTTVSSSKPDPTKVTSTGLTKLTPATNISASTGSKVQSEVPGKTGTSAPLDPIDALAGSLPPSKPVTPKEPAFTGPKVKESRIISGEAHRCGERDDTLPPGYRKIDMEKKMPADKPEKPKEVTKPLTTDDALDALSAGFESAPKPEKKTETVAASSAGKNFAPPLPDQKKGSVPASVSPAPPADKKPKVEKTAAAPSAQDTKPKAAEDPDMSLSALDALGDTLPAAKPVPESPKLRPEDLVKEKDVTSEKGVRVGERDDTLPPAYRFTEDKNKERPAPPKEPSMDTTEALDILSGDFTEPSAAPAVQAPVPPSASAKQSHQQQPKVEDLSALDALSGDFVAPAQAKKVSSGVPPAPAKSAPTTTPAKTPTTPGQSDNMALDALDALDALGDTLPAAQPVPESPKLRPEDLVDEKKLTSEKGVLVGEREDTLPPGYRFPKEDPQKHPAPAKKEPSLDASDALDILSGDFTTPSVASAVKAPVPPSAPPAASSDDFALEQLADDFVAPKSAPKVQSAASVPPKPDRQLSEGTASAMDALSDTLKDIGSAPEPKPVSPKDVIKEKTVVEERVTKPGERDDTLPPEYRPTEADIKAAAEAKAKSKADDKAKKSDMDDSKALDILSGDFTGPTPVTSAPAACHTQTASVKTSSTPKPSGPVLDKLADTLLPDLPQTTSTDSKPKVKGGKSKSEPKKPAVANVPAATGKPSTDVVSSSSTNKGGKS